MIENRDSVLAKIFTPYSSMKRRDGPSITNHLGEVVSASYGKERSSYDIRLREAVECFAGYMSFGIALEHCRMPYSLTARAANKSTNLRLGIKVDGELEPGWHGHLTIETTYNPPIVKVDGRVVIGPPRLVLPAGWGIAAIKFSMLAEDGDYDEDDPKYQGASEIQAAR